MLKKLLVIPFLSLGNASAYLVPRPSCFTSRKAFIKTCTAVVPSLVLPVAIAPKPALAFDGSGSSVYSGKGATSKADLKKSYQRRVVADVRDFKRLGEAVQKGETEGDAWVDFFIEYQRREPDSAGRTYAALVDLVGNKELSGCGILLAASFAKPGKPSEGLPSVKKYSAMAKMFDPIKAAGQKGDVSKAKDAYKKASDAVEAYLEAIELPPLTDALYD
ncbi:hypothetical protein ACHAW6_005101 [Cyclotella cf. meneghiniana]